LGNFASSFGGSKPPGPTTWSGSGNAPWMVGF
jgi:hypothetical protein